MNGLTFLRGHGEVLHLEALLGEGAPQAVRRPVVRHSRVPDRGSCEIFLVDEHGSRVGKVGAHRGTEHQAAKMAITKHAFNIKWPCCRLQWDLRSEE